MSLTTQDFEIIPMATGSISIGRNPNGTTAEMPQPLGQQRGAAEMVRLKPSSTEGVSTRAKDFVYIAKECGYPYLILAIGSLFAWYGAGWIGPNIIAKAIEPLATVAKTNEMLAEQDGEVRALMQSVEKTLERQTNILDAMSRGQAENTAGIDKILNHLKAGN